MKTLADLARFDALIDQTSRNMCGARERWIKWHGHRPDHQYSEYAAAYDARYRELCVSDRAIEKLRMGGQL